MKRKIFSKLLMGAFLIASVSMFVSCKDYDDDIRKNAADITALQAQLNDLKTNLTNDLNSAKNDLATAKVDLAAAKTELANAIDKKADATAVNALTETVTNLTGRVAALETQIAAIADCATKAELAAASQASSDQIEAVKNDILATITAITGDIEALKAQIPGNDDILAIVTANAASKSLETQVAALESFQKEVAAANYLTAADLKGVNDKIAELEAAIKAIDIPEPKEVDIEAIKAALQGDFQAISEKAEAVAAGLSTINMFVNKKLTSLVLNPNFYWEGIEGIEAPFIYQTPVFVQVDKPYSFSYKLTEDPAGDRTVDVKVAKYMRWEGLASSNRELGKYVIADAPAAHYTYPVALFNADGTLKRNNAGFYLYDMAHKDVQAVEKINIAYGAVAKYHLNPSIADITGATIGFYDHAAPVYTRGENTGINPEALDPTVAENDARISNGILTVPFKVNYTKIVEYFVNWTNSQTQNWEGSYGMQKEDWSSLWYKANNNAIVYGTYDVDTWRGCDKVSYGNDLPFVSLQVDVPANEEKGIEAYSVNSDYAVVVPALYEIVALADKNPDTSLDMNTFTKPNGTHEIRKNHLYETVGYSTNPQSMDANKATQRWNDVKGYGAIPMPATHPVLYNGSIDLRDYVETHFNYLTYAQYGKSTFDGVMDDQPGLMEKLGLEYRFTIIDYWLGNEETSESAHIEQADGKSVGSLFYPRSVDENGNTIKGQTATREALEREPLIRVDLVSTKDNNKIIRYGYIKLRIVDTLAKDQEVAITLNKDLYMNCGDEAKITWSQVENLILAKLGTEGLSKQEFEKYYKLDVYGDYEYMPFLDPKAYDSNNNDKAGTLYTRTWQAKRYFKKSGAAPTNQMSDCNSADYTNAIDGDLTSCDDDSLNITWTNINNHFGEVWYTPHDNGTAGQNWDPQTNVLIWNFFPGEIGVSAYDARTSYVATPLGRENAGNMNKAKYATMMKALGVNYGNQGTSQKEVSTVVRFINKQTDRSIWVTLTVPAQKIHFEYGKIDNKDWSHWFKFNANNYEGSYGTLEGESANKYPYWSEFDTRINPFKPSNVNYLFLEAETTKATSLVQKLSDHWMNPGEMVVLEGQPEASFSKFYTSRGGVDPQIAFTFTVPEEGNNSNAGASLAARTITLTLDPQWPIATRWNNAWTVFGASGTEWTLVLGDHIKGAGAGNNSIWAVGKNGRTYGAEEIAYLDGSFTASNGNTINNVDLHYHGLETPGIANLYPAATDLINLSGAYDSKGGARFTKGAGLTNLTQATFFEKNINEAFTAYIKINVAHDCYDPLIDKQFFNVRFHRPINVVGKEYSWNDRVLNDNTIEIKDLVEMIDWNDFALVAYNSGAVPARRSWFGVDYPKYADVFEDATHVKKQNLGLPYEYYGIQQLAVRYDEIRTDHAKQPGVRNNAQFTESWILNNSNTDLVKNVPSLFSERQNVTDPNGVKYRTVTLLNADNTVVPFTTAHAFNHSAKNAQGSYQYGRLYYNNDASDVQLFHIYIPIAVKYNWGNIAWDDTLNDQPGVKLNDDYTQTVWAVITVTGTH